MSVDKDALIYLADVRIDELETENAKLRELVCDLYEAYEGEVNDCWLVEFRERMRELGIEVDGWLRLATLRSGSMR